MTDVAGRVAVVTGAGGGIGREHALLLASEGARVVANDLGSTRDGAGGHTSPAHETVEAITRNGGEAIADHHDVADPEGAASLVDAALEHFGRIDIVVNNAGILRDRTFHKMTSDEWSAVIRVHLDGTYHVTRAAWPHLREQKHGRVIVTSSTSGLFGNFGQANYAAAKMGVVGLVRTLALEGQRYGITANAVVPIAATRMTRDVMEEELLTRLDPAYVAPLVVHLASDDCETRGAIILAGGGLYARIELVQGAGLRLEDVPTPQELAERWNEVEDLGGIEPAAFPF